MAKYQPLRKFVLVLPNAHVTYGPHLIVDPPAEHADHWFFKANTKLFEADPAPPPDGALEANEAPAAPAPAADADADPGSEGEVEPETDEELQRDAELESKGVTRDELLKQAEELNLKIDRRWGMARLQAAIDTALAG